MYRLIAAQVLRDLSAVLFDGDSHPIDIILPVGTGDLLLGFYLGLKDCERAGLISPGCWRLFGALPAGDNILTNLASAQPSKSCTRTRNCLEWSSAGNAQAQGSVLSFGSMPHPYREERLRRVHHRDGRRSASSRLSMSFRAGSTKLLSPNRRPLQRSRHFPASANRRVVCVLIRSANTTVVVAFW